MSAYNEKLQNIAVKEANQISASAKSAILLATLAALALGVLSAFYITRIIISALTKVSFSLSEMSTNCINNLQEGLRKLADGDLRFAVQATTQQVDLNTKDELGQMAQSFNHALNGVQESIAVYTEARTSLTTVVSKLSANADELSRASQTLAATSE